MFSFTYANELNDRYNNQGIRDIEASVITVNEIFQDLATLVDEVRRAIKCFGLHYHSRNRFRIVARRDDRYVCYDEEAGKWRKR